MNISPDKWIVELLGYNEKELLSRLKNNDEIIVNEKYKKVSGGEFNTYTIAELKGISRDPTELHRMSREQAKLKTMTSNDVQSESSSKRLLPLFTIYVRKPGNRDDLYYDTSSLQRIIKSEMPVMFQVASNFNCHENASVRIDLFSGRYLTNLMDDSTQGPSASSGAGAGAIVRYKYHYKNPIQLLKYTDANVVNGKLLGIGKDLDIDNIQIGLLTDATANYDRSEFCKCVFYPDDSPMIDQVFTSTISLMKGCKNKKELAAVDSLLNAAYSGTYLSAIYRKTNKLVLTMIGGGVFNNPMDKIITSIVNAHTQYAPISNLDEVILPLYDSRIDHSKIVNQLTKNGYPIDRIQILMK